MQGSPPVRALLEHDPFPDAAPRLVRSTLYLYSFPDQEDAKRSGAWWHRQKIGPYCPEFTLKRGHVVTPRPVPSH